MTVIERANVRTQKTRSAKWRLGLRHLYAGRRGDGAGGSAERILSASPPWRIP
jgi:hypothetical protein